MSTIASFDIKPFDAPLGAEVLGRDLAAPLGDREFAALHRAHLDHHVLVFRDQRITPAQQVEFSRRFGRLQIHVLRQFQLPSDPAVLIISNIKDKGQPIGLGDAGHYWHSDLSYKAVPSLGSMLHAQQLPADGGDTLFANQHSAWETLPGWLQRAVEGVSAEHSYLAKYAELQQRSPWRPLALLGSAFYPVLVHRLAVSLPASSPRLVALPQLRFASLAVVSLRRDLHPQECAHAGRTKKARH